MLKAKHLERDPSGQIVVTW